MPSRYGKDSGYFLELAGAAANESVTGGERKTVLANTRIVDIGADVDFLAVIPFCEASITSAGTVVDFEFVGRLEAVTFETNPQIVRLSLDGTTNRGPKDLLPVLGYRQVKLTAIENNASAVLTGVNVEYRQMRSSTS